MIPDISAIPWEQYGVDVVVDATGAFTKKEDLMKHIRGTVKKVILTAPAKDETTHVVLGVNDDKVDFAKEQIISNASCTTNCAAPMFKVLHDNFKVLSGYINTIHAYTATQSLLDEASKNQIGHEPPHSIFPLRPQEPQRRWGRLFLSLRVNLTAWQCAFQFPQFHLRISPQSLRSQ